MKYLYVRKAWNDKGNFGIDVRDFPNKKEVEEFVKSEKYLDTRDGVKGWRFVYEIHKMISEDACVFVIIGTHSNLYK